MSMAQRYWNSWLPEAVATAAAQEEPKRFHTAVQCFVEAVAAALPSDDPNKWVHLLPWIDVIKRCAGHGSVRWRHHEALIPHHVVTWAAA